MPLLFLIILLEGFVSVALEILTIRQLIPFVGNSVIVTSLIIGIFLLFLAIGYWRGGKYTNNFYVILKRNFIWSSIFIGIGLSYLFLSTFFGLIITYLIHSVFVILGLYLLFIIAPLVYFLGQTIPITMNLVKQEKLVGAIGGKVLFLSTIGSFFGAVLTSILLMEFLGVAWTVFVNFILLFSLTLFIPKDSTEPKILFGNKIANAIIAISLILLVYVINIYFEKIVFIETTNYANYNIEKHAKIDNREGNLLKINASYSSFIDKNKAGFPYIETIKKILFNDLKLQNKNILVIGAGGFTLSANQTNNNNFTYVDIDPKIKNIIQNNFLSNVNGKFIAKDARVFFNHNNEHYDAIISDAYSNIDTIPTDLITAEHFNNIKNHLNIDGVAIFNIVAKPFLTDAYSKHLDSTIRTIFANCMAIPQTYSSEITNIIYVCKNSLNVDDKSIYTDNKNSATIDYFFNL